MECIDKYVMCYAKKNRRLVSRVSHGLKPTKQGLKPTKQGLWAPKTINILEALLNAMNSLWFSGVCVRGVCSPVLEIASLNSSALNTSVFFCFFPIFW